MIPVLIYWSERRDEMWSLGRSWHYWVPPGHSTTSTSPLAGWWLLGNIMRGSVGNCSQHWDTGGREGGNVLIWCQTIHIFTKSASQLDSASTTFFFLFINNNLWMEALTVTIAIQFNYLSNQKPITSVSMIVLIFSLDRTWPTKSVGSALSS